MGSSDSDPFDLERFLEAQARVLQNVRQELRSGRKRSHWMWYIFPQLRGLGHSPTAQHFAISGIDEARAYLQHPLLGARLIECTQLVNGIEDRSIHAVFGDPDDLKFRSCMTLFGGLPSAPPVFAAALARYFAGADDPMTIALLDKGAGR